MPSDPYQITVSGDNEISITLSDVGVSTPDAHASTHLTTGSDPIQLATNAREGLASAEHIATLESHTTSIAAINDNLGGIDIGVLSVSVTAPITKTGTTNPTIGLPASTSSVDGYMSAAQAQKLASITDGATANSIAVSSPSTTASSDGVQTLAIPAASASAHGYMSISDKVKLDSMTSGAAISTVSVSAPLAKSGTTAPTISFQDQEAGKVFSGPLSGNPAAPSFKTLTPALLGFKSGRATVINGTAGVLDEAITAGSIIVATQEFMGTSSAPVGESSDLVIEWCTKNTSGGATVVTTELVQNTGAKYYALDPYDTVQAQPIYSFFTDAEYTVTAEDFVALFRGGSDPPIDVAMGHSFWDSNIMRKRRSIWNYDVEAEYDLTYCQLYENKIQVPQASNTWGVGKGGSLIIEPAGTYGLKVIIPRNLKMSAWGTTSPYLDAYAFQAMPTEKCYWFDGGFVPSTFTPPSNSNIAPSALVYPSTVTPKPIYINGVATNVMFPRLQLASDAAVDNPPSALNRISVEKIAGSGFVIHSSNTVDTHYVDYVSYTP